MNRKQAKKAKRVKQRKLRVDAEKTATLMQRIIKRGQN